MGLKVINIHICCDRRRGCVYAIIMESKIIISLFANTKENFPHVNNGVLLMNFIDGKNDYTYIILSSDIFFVDMCR